MSTLSLNVDIPETTVSLLMFPVRFPITVVAVNVPRTF